MMPEDENPFQHQEIVEVVLTSSNGQLKISASQNSKFDRVARLFCERTGWMLSETRFILDGDRLQNDLTLLENEIQNHDVIEAFQQVFGGKGPTDSEILQMLEECNSDTEDVPELDEGPNKTDVDYKWYEDLKLEFTKGYLILDRSNIQDQKLLYLLETDHLQPYEIIRLRNVYLLWEQTKFWRAEVDGSKPVRTKRKVKATEEPCDRVKRPRRNIPDLSDCTPVSQSVCKLDGKPLLAAVGNTDETAVDIQEGTQDGIQINTPINKEPTDEVTPNKRRRLMEYLDLTTPSPLVTKAHVNEKEMKRMSVAVHLWAERKMGGVHYLQTSRLRDSEFEDILVFTGPSSKWKLMKGRTLAQLRSLWRNSFGGKHSYRGDKKTGFENEFQRHAPNDQFCPFGHCNSGIMSQMDVDLVLLTPQKKFLNVIYEQKTVSSRQLFKENCVHEDNSEDEKVISDENIPQETIASPLTALGSSVESVDDEQPFPKDVKEDHKDDTKEVSEIRNTTICKENLNYVCHINECRKSFQTFFGYERHIADKHSEERLPKKESKCSVCNKKVIYLDQHMRAKHSDLQKPFECEVCLMEISANISKHRKTCISCRYCDYQNIKKARLLNHIKKCQNRPSEIWIQTQVAPLDLRSPLKLPVDSLSEKHIEEETTTVCNSTLVCLPLSAPVSKLLCTLVGTPFSTPASTPGVTAIVRSVQTPVDLSDGSLGGSHGDKKVDKPYGTPVGTPDDNDEDNELLQRQRTMYPFDKESTDEDYYSELDVDDTEVFTCERRKKKDEMELQLREIDNLQNNEVEGDNMIVENFTQFLRNKRNKDAKVGGFSQKSEPSTINAYATVVRNDILRAFHKLVSPFDARWLIDCSSPKHCTFDGEERLHVDPKEPIYMTSRILQEALDQGNQRKQVIAAFHQLMEYIELHFTLKLNTYGVDVLSRVQTYHQGVKSFVKGTSQWKKLNDEEKDVYETNKIITDYESPNKDVEVLEKYKAYVKSEERILKMSKLLTYAHPDAEIPPPALMTEFGTIVMEEIVACTGCRPKVARHLKMGALVDAKPGFNPYAITKDDKTLEEDLEGEKIWRRVNPNLPPKERACIHQIEEKSAFCSENCDEQCIPEGFNIWVSWDKTQSTKGPYFLHIPTPVKNLMDRYDLIRSKYFEGKKPKFAANDCWLEDFDTPFFLNSACGIFPSLDLKKLSSLLGIDITAYRFRKIVSTWALTHKSEDIREAEEEALQHSLHVAKERYLQSKQIKPQNLTQTYTIEENLFPEKFRKELEKDKNDISILIASKQEQRARMRYAKLAQEKEASKKQKHDNRPLGVRKAILESDRNEFSQAFECETGSSIKTLVGKLKPIQFRDLIVRVVCSSGENCDKLRSLWLKIYKGDLLHGIRDLRRLAKEKNWPLRKQNPGRRDRNSWNAHVLRKSYQKGKETD